MCVSREEGDGMGGVSVFMRSGGFAMHFLCTASLCVHERDVQSGSGGCVRDEATPPHTPR